ncbi:TIGR01777 family oxidoreductase [Nafulsella turpanensis]|uniref:TIGR01777 family oxidoreductase n=1 Tax=Nafulsella turpanensis TaxID=1265690 RepID=UPI000347CE2E|nr:TIGR01777 family oxidoreductase [Nafulsella turpanensis]
MHTKVLITGGSGLLGSRLTALLLEKGYKVAHLSRSRNSDGEVKAFLWDPAKGMIEPGAVESAHYVVHLAGASVADHSWSKEYKETIIKSRSESTQLLFQELKTTGYQLKGFISASAIGYYGDENGAHWLNESSPAGQEFLAQVCKTWEAEADKIESLGIRLVKLRIGVVLSTEGGALPQLLKPSRFGLAAPLGSGRQYMSWIHIDDLCGIIIKAIEDSSMKGVYNAVAPEPETNERFMEILAGVLDKPFIVPAVPAFGIKLAMGERAGMVLGSLRVSSEKIENAGYAFQYEGLRPALRQLLD